MPKRQSKSTDDDPPQTRPSASKESGEGEGGEGEGEEKTKPTLPPHLLAKLVKSFTEDEGTKISAAAMRTLGEYMQLFLTEAVYRAVGSRREGDPWARTGAGLMLEVDDLEKITPQLLLDF